MINRGNWKLLKEYLRYREEIDQVSKRSLRNEETWLQHILEWAGENSIRNSPNIRPGFPIYMINARLDGKSEQLSKAYIEKVIRSARRFLIGCHRIKQGIAKLHLYTWVRYELLGWKKYQKSMWRLHLMKSRLLLLLLLMPHGRKELGLLLCSGGCLVFALEHLYHSQLKRLIWIG